MGVAANVGRMAVGIGPADRASSTTCRRSRLACRRPARGRRLRRVLRAAPQPCHGQHRHPRNGIRRQRAVVRQHALLVPVHARSAVQLRPALEAAVRQGLERRRPLPPERARHVRRPARGFVTAFAVTDEPEGWRPCAIHGGILMEIASGASSRTACRCRIRRASTAKSCGCWNPGRARWRTSIAAPASSRPSPSSPGFTRGLDFAGNLAFVGLSKVRRKQRLRRPADHGAAAGGRAVLRYPGARPVDRPDHGGWLRFDSGVADIFAVSVLHGHALSRRSWRRTTRWSRTPSRCRRKRSPRCS